MPNQPSRRKFLKISLVMLVGAPIMMAAGYSYAREIEPQWVEVVNKELRLPRLYPAFDGYRLVQISDIHMGIGMTAERLLHIDGFSTTAHRSNHWGNAFVCATLALFLFGSSWIGLHLHFTK